jgi:lysozyme family protein
MENNFEKAYKHVLKNEGGYCNVKEDRGGETYKGITRRYNPKWEGWLIIDEAKDRPKFPKNLEKIGNLQALVRNFYWSKWKSFKLDKIDDYNIAVEIYDTATNMGLYTAIRILQRSLNCLNRLTRDWKDIKADGKIGSETINVTNLAVKKRKKNILKAMNILQGAKYIEFSEKDKNQEIFVPGWLTHRVSL